LGGKPAGKRTLGRHRRRKEEIIKIHLQELKADGVHWIHLAREPVACCSEHGN